MKKSNYLLIIILLFTFIAKAQDVKFKDNKVLVDKTARFDFIRKGLGDEFSLYKLNTKDEIIYMALDRNGSNQYQDDDFKRFTFIESKIIVESSRLKFTTWKSIIELLLEEKILDLEGNIDVTNLEKFVAKYNDMKR